MGKPMTITSRTTGTALNEGAYLREFSYQFHIQVYRVVLPQHKDSKWGPSPIRVYKNPQ